MRKFLIAFVLLLTTGAFMNFVASDSDALAVTLKGDAEMQWLWAAIDAIVVFGCCLRWRELVAQAKQQVPLLLFIAWGAASIGWSDDPALSVRRVVALLFTSALGLYLGAVFDMRTLARIVGLAFALAVIGSFVAAVFFPSHGLMSGALLGAWRGLFTHKNTMARVMGLAALTFFALFVDSNRRRTWYAILIAGSLSLILFSHSASAALITTATFLVCFWRRLRLNTMQAAALLALTLLVGVLGQAFLSGHMDAVFDFLGKDETMTGRTTLWSLAFEAASKRPVLGAGWDVFWGTAEGDRIRALIGWDAPHAHNAFLDFTLNVGVIGLLIFLFALGYCVVRAIRYGSNPSNPMREWPLAFYTFIFIYMFPETMLVDRHSIFQIMFFSISVAMTRAQTASVQTASMPKLIIRTSAHVPLLPVAP